MEETLCSLNCPNCGNSLVETIILRLGILIGAQCPYCSTPLRWSKAPLLLFFFGATTTALGLYLFYYPNLLPPSFAGYTLIAAAVGGGISLFSLMFLHLEVNQRSAPRERHNTCYYSPV